MIQNQQIALQIINLVKVIGLILFIYFIFIPQIYENLAYINYIIEKSLDISSHIYNIISILCTIISTYYVVQFLPSTKIETLDTNIEKPLN